MCAPHPAAAYGNRAILPLCGVPVTDCRNRRRIFYGKTVQHQRKRHWRLRPLPGGRHGRPVSAPGPDGCGDWDAEAVPGFSAGDCAGPGCRTGEAAAAAAIGEFLKQLLSYGFTATTVLWLIPPALRGAVIGFAALKARRSGWHLEDRPTVYFGVSVAAALLTPWPIRRCFGWTACSTDTISPATFWAPCRRDW